MRESSLWDWLKRGTADLGDRLHMTRTEEALGAKGRPDVEGCYDGGSFIVELKVASRPKRAETPIRTQEPVKEEQCLWLEARVKAGGMAWLLVQVGERHEARRYLVWGKYARAIKAGVTESRLAAIAAKPGDADAKSIVETMAYH